MPVSAVQQRTVSVPQNREPVQQILIVGIPLPTHVSRSTLRLSLFKRPFAEPCVLDHGDGTEASF